MPTSPNMNFDINHTRVVLDVTLVHAFDSNGAFKKDGLKAAANAKDRHYRDGYLIQGFASAPAACNTLGQLESEFLRFLFNCADLIMQPAERQIMFPQRTTIRTCSVKMRRLTGNLLHFVAVPLTGTE